MPANQSIRTTDPPFEPPPVPRLLRPPRPLSNDDLEAMIPKDDAEQLSYYFATGSGLSTRSNFGVVVEQIAKFHTWPFCKKCSGTGFISTTGKPRRLSPQARWILQMQTGHRGAILRDRMCPECEGTGRANPWHRCPVCNGTGFDSDATDGRCEFCGELGWVSSLVRPNAACHEKITAWPTGSSKHGGGPPADHDLANRLGEASRRLDAITALSALAAAVLEAFWGPDGEHWRQSREGRVFAIYPLTPAGRTLLKQHRHSAAAMPVHMRMGSILEVQREQPNPRRAQQLEAAHEQAVELYRAAAELWCQQLRREEDARCRRSAGGAAVAK